MAIYPIAIKTKQGSHSMKKHLFAASVTTALAVTSASVAAESSVTLYGVIDTGPATPR